MLVQNHFENTITPRDKGLNFGLGEILRHRDLLFLFVKRDFIAKYKQTILGPAWFFIQPILQTTVMTVVFANMASLSTDGVPPVLFYLSGLTAWNYFSQCLLTTASTFTSNASLFGKVYFPRAITPIAIVISNLIQFGIGLGLFVAVYIYYAYLGFLLRPNELLLILPILVLIMGAMGLGLGMLISAMTTKYRDLQHLVSFGVQLLMYATPVIIPLATVPVKYKIYMLLNPMTGIIETFKYIFFTQGDMPWTALAYSITFAICIFLIGLLIFNKTEKNFMDTV